MEYQNNNSKNLTFDIMSLNVHFSITMTYKVSNFVCTVFIFILRDLCVISLIKVLVFILCQKRGKMIGIIFEATEHIN